MYNNIHNCTSTKSMFHIKNNTETKTFNRLFMKCKNKNESFNATFITNCVCVIVWLDFNMAIVSFILSYIDETFAKLV